jgi:hypothetical protein
VKARQKLHYEFPPTVTDFLRCDDFVRIIRGPIGSGKSSGCVTELLRRARDQAPSPDGIRRSRWAVVRNTYRELKDTTRKTFEQWIPAQLGVWKEQDFTFEMRFKLKDGTRVEADVLFRALDRPEDVNKVLSLELTGAYLNEIREIPKSIFDALQGRIGRYPSRAQGGPTWFGLWGDSNPWHSGHWISKLYEQHPTGFAMFRQPGGRSPDAENVENLPQGYYERLIHGKDTEWVKVYVDGEDAASDQGSIYGDLINELQKRGGISAFAHEVDGCFVTYDLGFSDSTAAWIWRIRGGALDFIDHYEARGQPLSHYFDVLEKRSRERGYDYFKHWLPHDARARTLATGSSIQDQFNARFGPAKVDIVPSLSLADGIQATRWLLEQDIRIHERCAQGIEALREYRYDWDEEARCFSRRPLHDWTSHSSDAFRYAAIVAKHSELISRKDAQVAKLPAGTDMSWTMDEVWEDHLRSFARDRD